MLVRYDDISARCHRCGWLQFERIGASSLFACLRCGVVSAHADLLSQIGDEAARRSQHAFDAMRLRLRRRLEAISAAEAVPPASAPATPAPSGSPPPPPGEPPAP